MVKSPNFKGSSHAQFFGILKKIHIFTRRIVCPLFHDAKFGHTFINIKNNWTGMYFSIQSCEFTIYIKCLSNYQY